ncbi:MAG: RNA methyltransferase [Sediminibacterium sp.]|nr:RNA methyltransferase [Sediminibacterium sp.]MBX9778735.1 RNA methyltransferase [Chitinophagaceae bacterium]
MISKNEAKYIQSLFQKKQRDILGVFVAEGVKLAHELIQSGIDIEQIYATEDWEPEIPAPIPIQRVSAIELSKISGLQTPNKVLVIAKKPSYSFKGIPEKSFSLALDGIQDPGNLGTLIRIADWFGITTIIASEDTADCYNPKVVQATMGSITRVQIVYTDISKALANTHVPSFGALLEGKNMNTFTPVKEGVLVIGNESKGIRKEVVEQIQHAIHIPRRGQAESLNAAVAAGILISHLYK